MSDPISPLGSLGQVVPTAQAGAPTLGTDAKTSVPKSVSTKVTPPDLVETLSTGLSTEKASQAQQPQTFAEAAKALETHLKQLSTDLQFRVDAETGITTFKVINPVTKEVIREYPPKEVLEMAKHIKELTQSKKTGLLVDEKH